MEKRTIEECFYQIRNGANIKQGAIEGGFPITRIETVSNDKFHRDRMGYAGITDIGKYESYILEDGDLLMSHINSVQYLGRTVLYQKQGNETIIHGMNLLGLKANRNIINPAYARYYFYSPMFREQIRRITKKSVNQASFAVSDLKKLTILVPSLEEQAQVVEVLDKINMLIDLRQNELQKLDELVKSRFIELFGEPMENPHNYPVKRIDEVAELVKGITYSPEEVCDKDGIVVLRSSNIKGSAFDLQDIVIISKKVSSEKLVKENDILMCNRNGSARLVGKVALIPKLDEGMTFGTFMTIVRSQMYKYLFVFFQMEAFRRQIQFQTAVAINQISLPLLASVTVPIPLMELQEQFAAFVEQTDKSKFVIQKAIDELQTLYDSLMQEYFG